LLAQRCEGTVTAGPPANFRAGAVI